MSASPARPRLPRLRAVGALCAGGLLTAGVLLSGPVACDDPVSSSAPDLRQAILRSWAEQLILPAYETFSQRTDALRDAAATFCAAPDAAGLTATRAAWNQARGAFDQISVFKFGPHIDYPARLGPNLNFWPARPDTIEALIASETPLSPESVAGQGAAARGLPAVEYVLYGAGAETLAGFDAGDRRCVYLTAASADAAALADALALAWSPDGGGFVYELTEPETKGFSLTSVQEALSEVVNRMLFALDDMRAEKLGKPLGTATPSPESAESRFSGRAVQDLRDVLVMIELLYHGAEVDGALGLDDDPRIIARPDVTERFDAALQVARARLDDIPGTLSEAVVSAPETVQAASDAMRGVQVVLQTDVRALLSLNAAFNDADND